MKQLFVISDGARLVQEGETFTRGEAMEIFTSKLPEDHSNATYNNDEGIEHSFVDNWSITTMPEHHSALYFSQ